MCLWIVREGLGSGRLKLFPCGVTVVPGEEWCYPKDFRKDVFLM